MIVNRRDFHIKGSQLDEGIAWFKALKYENRSACKRLSQARSEFLRMRRNSSPWPSTRR